MSMQQAHPIAPALPEKPFGMLSGYLAARRNLLEIIPALALEDDVVSGQSGPQRWHMLVEPAALRRVLLEAVADYPKSDTTRAILQPAVGESLLLAEGDHWRWQRRAVAPTLSARNVEALGPVMSAAAEKAIARLETSAGRHAVNMHEEMVAATLEVISGITFSDEDTVDQDSVSRSMDAYIGSAAKLSILDVIGAPLWLPRPQRIGANALLREMQDNADRAIEARLKSGPGAVPDLLDRLLAARDGETGRQMTPREVRENLLTFIAAGHETTAVTLAWAFYLLAVDPEAQARLATEAKSVLQGRVATAEDCAALPFARAVVEETMRLYPAIGMVSRTAKIHDRLAGAEIRPGDSVILPIYALHRHRKHWDNPDAFQPERFLDERPTRFTYLPFGDGPRICIGAQLALQEAVILLASLVARFDVSPVPGKQPTPVMIMSLRPEGGVWLLHKRR